MNPAAERIVEGNTVSEHEGPSSADTRASKHFARLDGENGYRFSGAR